MIKQKKAIQLDDKSKWTPTEWSHSDNIGTFKSAIVIRLSTSPFYRGQKFAVIDGRCCLSKSGQMEYEPMPSSRTAAFYKRCRFNSFDDAIKAISKYVKASK